MLKEKLMEDLKQAMKSKDTILKNTIQLARAAVLQIEKDKLITLDDDAILEVISKEAKKRNDALPIYEKSGRQDLIDQLKREYSILMEYLPMQLSDAELEDIVRKAIKDTDANGIKDMGKVMSAVIAQTKGRADGKLINNLVRNLLS